jgi:hypothetical protein
VDDSSNTCPKAQSSGGLPRTRILLKSTTLQSVSYAESQRLRPAQWVLFFTLTTSNDTLTAGRRKKKTYWVFAAHAMITFTTAKTSCGGGGTAASWRNCRARR